MSLTNLSSNGFRQQSNQNLTRFNGNVGAQIGKDLRAGRSGEHAREIEQAQAGEGRAAVG